MTSSRDAADTPPKKADLILANGHLFPASVEQGRTLSLAIAGGRIAGIGTESDLAPQIGPRTQRIDLKGKTLLPGFVDAHLHPLHGGLLLLQCDLTGRFSVGEYQDVIRAFSAAHPDRPLIRGGGWTAGAFPQSGPDRAMLDAVIPDRPVLLKAMDGHSMWVNSIALRQAGIHADTPQPDGGHIEINPATGEPTGWLKEWSAMALAECAFPPVSPADYLDAARAFMRKAAHAGITAVQDAMVSESEFQAYNDLDRRNELTVRVHGAALCRPQDTDADRDRIRQWLQRPVSAFFRMNAVKLFADGVVEAHTARLKEPYTDQPDNRGTLIWPEEQFIAEAERWNALGAGVHIHAIGDEAVRLAVDALEQSIGRHGARDARHQIAHLDLADRPELLRMQQLGLIAVVQPAWFYIDHGFFDTTLPYLGRERAFRQYALRTMLDLGIPIAGSTDWPYGGDAAAFHPLESIQVGLTRLGLHADYPNAFVPEQCVSLHEMLMLCTRGGAYALGREHEFGVLKPGMLADLVVLDGDLFQTPATEIYRRNVLLTLMEGRPVYADSVWRSIGQCVSN